MGNFEAKGKLPIQPPPLPPKPQESYEPHVYKLDSSVPDYESAPLKTNAVGSPMPLDDFVHEHHKEFPILAEVSDSLYRVCEDCTLMERQIFTAHFLKKSNVADMSLEPLGPNFTVPINSSFRFG